MNKGTHEVTIGAEVVNTADRAFKEINEISRTIASQTQTVSATTEEQSASIQEIASASQMLSKMAEELEAALTKFKVWMLFSRRSRS